MDVNARFDELMAFVLGPRPDDEPCATCGHPASDHERCEYHRSGVEFAVPCDVDHCRCGRFT